MAKKVVNKVKSEEKSAASATKPESKSKLKAKAEAEAAEVPFEVKKYHKMALQILLHCQHFLNKPSMTFGELSREIGVGEKTKAWQCEAWKDLRQGDYIVSAGGSGNWMLSEVGVRLAKTFASDEDLADMQMPTTNEEHHAKIKSRLASQKKTKKYGPKILDYMLEESIPLTKKEIAENFEVDSESHGFFYGFQALGKMGIIRKNGQKKGGKQLWELTEKAFLATGDANGAGVPSEAAAKKEG